MDLETKNVNELRLLAVDMIERANSGHPGIALGSAPILYALYSKVLNVVPEDDKNILRDRFIMSAGHGSSIYYAMLHAFGYKISLNDLKSFRKLDSITPGHPEYGAVPGVDATTGPLGQGVSMAVGMALAERIMAKRFNKADITLFDNYTYTLVGEGCLMEGVSYEALSLAGTLKLNKLIVLYDCNGITLDSSTKSVMDQNILGYFKSLNFSTIEVEDGNDVEGIIQAINVAKQSKDKPTFIKINTHIGYGSALQDSNKAHGSVLGADNVKLLRETLGVTSEPFELDKNVLRDLKFLSKRFDGVKKSFKERMKVYSKAYPGDYKVLNEFLNMDTIKAEQVLADLNISEDMSGRDMGGLVLNKLAEVYSNLICGAADVCGSTKVNIKNSGFINDDFANKNIKYGIREFGMGCISNGLALYGGLVPVNSTFLVFSDYMKSAMRLSALMGQKVISVFTHDSIAVGEDGATHQSSEQMWGIRNIPHTYLFRPANLAETKAAYLTALSKNNPTTIVLSRQKLKNIASDVDMAKRGGYILSPEGGTLNGVIIATGSEVGLALDVQAELKSKGYNVRVVSMPSVELFKEQPLKYRNDVIPTNIKSVFSIEAGASGGWYEFTGRFGKCFAVDEFGASAPYQEIYNKFGLTSEIISKEIMQVIKNNKEKTI
ncbi:MAG: transketolase [Clostridiales bacterium]|nr:transketolase [Clostridiales bacterium]